MSDWSEWVSWSERHKLPGLQYPGIYAIACGGNSLKGKEFSYLPEIAYFGMTNSKGGLKTRLQQFDNTIDGKEGHGGAKRFRKKYPDYNELIEKLYVSVKVFKCDPASNNPEDLLIMGKVAEFEYICFAEYVRHFGRLPEFNDKARSPKE